MASSPPPPPVAAGAASVGRAPRSVAMLAALILAVGLAIAPTNGSPVAAACGSFQSLVNVAGPRSTITIPPCVYHEQVRISKPLTINASGVVVDGDNVRDIGVAVTADDVTINGLTVTHVNGGSHVGAVWTTGVSRFTFRGGAARDSATVCISLNGGTGHRVLDSELSGCGREGYFMNGVSDTLFAGNRIHDNNTALAWDPADEAGGGKTMASHRVTFDGNEVAHNGGPGIWFDNGDVDVTATNNRVHDNDRAGIFFEISEGAEIAHNAVWNNGFGFVAWGYGAGITISSSDAANVHDNTVAWNARGISVISQDRQLQPHTGNAVHDNVVISREGSFVTGWYDDHGGSLFGASNGNSGYGNRYWIGSGEPSTDRFQWAGQRTSLADYNATLGEEGATYLTDPERDAALQAAGIPGIDGAPPSGTPGPAVLRAPVPRPVLGPGQMTARAAIPGRVTWATSPGATAYQVQVQRDGGAWRSLATMSAGSRSSGVTYENGSRYRARVRARDASGAWTSWATSVAAAVDHFQETSPTIHWTGSWTRARSDGASGAFVRYAAAPGATATFSFVGRSVAWVAPRGHTRGSVRVYVDGVYRATISLYRPATTARSLVFSTSWSSSGAHTVAIRVVGTKGHPRIDVDAFAILR